ncbi:MAG: hypothetical protein R3E88_15555 [Myxococcota bacterium]
MAVRERERERPIPTRIEPSAALSPLSPARVARAFRALLDDGARLRVSGAARRRPLDLLARGYVPRFAFELFDTRVFVTDALQNPDIRFFVAYVVQPRRRGRGLDAFARIFYKDLSLVWRSSSHFSREDGALWVGKGDVLSYVEDGREMVTSIESTTDLPFEMQAALEDALRRTKRVRNDERALDLVLHRAPSWRIEPYADFTEPRARAAADPRNLVNGGRAIARFRRPGDPGSLVFAKGYEPDFRGGALETLLTKSSLYGGPLGRHRILSRNRRIQYTFIAAPRHVWLLPPQALTTELSSYGVRTIDVVADDDLFVPGYEYHFVDDTQDPPALYSQIPDGYAGAQSPHDDAKADASPWLDALPVVQEFRRVVLGRSRRTARC